MVKITRVLFEKEDKNDKSLAVCSIIFDDSLKLNGIKLYKSEEKGYYLVLPSKQDDYREVQELNPDVKLNVPVNKDPKKQYEEFFFPLDSLLYKSMLRTVTYCFEKFKEEGRLSFHL